MLYLKHFILFWVVGWVSGKAEIITNSAQLGLGLGLSLAKLMSLILGLYNNHHEIEGQSGFILVQLGL